MMINGFLVVRTPEMNFDPEGRGAYSRITPCLLGLCYSGVDRMPWFDLFEQVYADKQAENLAHALRRIKHQNADFTGLDLCTDPQEALALLRQSNAEELRNELIGVHSEKLSQVKGAFMFDDRCLDWLGYDVVALGFWSLLESGLFAVPAAFTRWFDLVNDHGLLREPSADYVAAYEAAARQGLVEEIPAELYGVDFIRVSRVIVE